MITMFNLLRKIKPVKSSNVDTLDDSEVDPLAEADVYIAFGRKEQAVEILRCAIIKNPDRNDLKIALTKIESTSQEENRIKDFDISLNFNKLSNTRKKIVIDLINHLLTL